MRRALTRTAAWRSARRSPSPSPTDCTTGAWAPLLVEHLVSAARAEGITTFTADALSENHEVLRLFADLGLRTSRRFEGPEVRCVIHLDEDDAYLSAVEARGRAADVASLLPE